MFESQDIAINWNDGVNERMLVIEGFFAVGAEVKVLADSALVTDSIDRINFAAITCESLVNLLKVLDNISDNIFDQFSFLEGKAVDIEFVRLA